MTVRIPRFSCALKMKIWLLISLICCAYLCGVCFGVDIEPCSPAVKNDSCNITCRVLDFNQGIEFKCNGSSRGQCSIFNCPSNMIKEGQTMLHLHIPMLSYTTDNCEWTCTYGGTSSAPANIIIYSGISSSNLTSQTNADGSVHLTATADCLYPSNPSVDVEYSYQSGGQYVSLGQKVDLQSSNVPGLCSDVIESRITATFHASGDLAVLKGKNVFFRMKFLQYQSALPTYSNEVGPFYFEGLTTPSSTISSDMSTTVSEPQSTINSDMPTTVSEPLSTISSDMPTTVSEVPPPPINTSSAGLSQKIVITITISSILAAGVLILLIVLVMKQCRQKNRETPAKKKENSLAKKQYSITRAKKQYSITRNVDMKAYKPRKSNLSGKRNTKQESISLDKVQQTQFNNSAPKDRMYQHYPQTPNYWNGCGSLQVYYPSTVGKSTMLHGNWQQHSNNRILYQSRYPEHPGHNEEMLQYYRADNLYRGQQFMYQRPYVAQYDHHIKDKPINERNSEGRTYERNWDFLY